MLSWDNLFDGYNVYTDVSDNHPNIYTESSNDGSYVTLYDQFIKSVPQDLDFVFGAFHASIVPLVLMMAIIFVFFMPFFKRPRTW